MAEPFQLFEKPLLKYSWVVRFGYTLRLLMYKWRLCPAPSYEWSENWFLGSLWPSLASVYLCAQLDLAWPDLTLHDDLWGYYCFLANNCWLKQDTSFKVVPMYSAPHGESVDMQHDPLESRSWPWPEVKSCIWSFWVKLCIIRGGTTRKIRWWQCFLHTFIMLDLILS